MAVFASRQIVMPVLLLPVAVTITGKGDASYCYAIINGTKRYSIGTFEVYAGDTITFGVAGSNFGSRGSVTINGTQVLEATGSATQTYDWTVPNGISTIEIAMGYISNKGGTITVTTA